MKCIATANLKHFSWMKEVMQSLIIYMFLFLLKEIDKTRLFYQLQM